MNTAGLCQSLQSLPMLLKMRMVRFNAGTIVGIQHEFLLTIANTVQTCSRQRPLQLIINKDHDNVCMSAQENQL